MGFSMKKLTIYFGDPHDELETPACGARFRWHRISRCPERHRREPGILLFLGGGALRCEPRAWSHVTDSTADVGGNHMNFMDDW